MALAMGMEAIHKMDYGRFEAELRLANRRD
jgi:hypothetical protein